MRPSWIGPFGLPERMADQLRRAMETLAAALGGGRRWFWLGLAAGALPLAVEYSTGWPGGRLATALLFAPLLVAAAARDSLRLAAAGVGTGFAVRCALAVGLVACDPERLDRLMPDGLEYWRQSQAWIETGVSEEYDVSAWLPAHVQLLAAAAILAYSSLGLVTLWHGLHEVDLMNWYVGHLVLRSRSAWVAVAGGWHVWSLFRGLGFLVITFEVASWSLERLTGAPLSTRARRRGRWLLGLSLLAMDGALKVALMGPVRDLLKQNLL